MKLGIDFWRLKHFAQVYKNALRALQTKAIIHCDICIVMLVHFNPDAASKPGMENLELIAWPVGYALHICKDHASDQSVMCDAESDILIREKADFFL